jgi:hypothetical protein
MKCPHCLENFNSPRHIIFLGEDVDGKWGIELYYCTNESCKKSIAYLSRANFYNSNYHGGKYLIENDEYENEIVFERILVRPVGISRSPVPIEVSLQIASDYIEACNVLPYSPKASAALSRRCLQNLLVEKAGVVKKDLADQIQEVMESKQLPSWVASDMDAIRNVGNYAAHPKKSKSTGEIVDVEPHEAEWNLDVLELLFDFYYVQPELSKKKRDALNEKLSDIGKPPMKK